MKGIKSKFRILNSFQESKKTGLGRDYSYDYSKSKNLNLYIYDTRLDSLITFKSFLESFSIAFEQPSADSEGLAGSAVIDITGMTCIYSVNLQVPSISLGDAKVNDARFSELSRMVAGEVNIGNGQIRSRTAPKRVLLGNLIHNGNFTENNSVTSLKNVVDFGLRCHFKNVKWEPDIELGFFEDHIGGSNKMYPKAYSLNLNLEVHFTKDASILEKRYLVGFEADGSYNAQDKKNWPFGV